MFKEKFKKLLNDIIFPFTAIFTVLILFLGICSYGVFGNRTSILVNDMLVWALYSFIVALLNRIFYIKQLIVYIRMAIHFIFSTLSLYLILLIFTKNISSETANMRLALVLLYAIVYVIAATVYTCVRETKKLKKPGENKKQSPEEYESIYGNKK